MVKSQHEEEVEELYDSFEETISERDVRWDEVRKNEDIVLEDGRCTDADVVLFNYDDMKALSIEVKTSENAIGKAGRQMDKAEEFYESRGYEARSSLHVVERNDHLQHDEFMDAVRDELGEPFTKNELEDVIEYARSWATFGCLHGQGVVTETEPGLYEFDESAYQEFWSASD